MLNRILDVFFASFRFSSANLRQTYKWLSPILHQFLQLIVAPGFNLARKKSLLLACKSTLKNDTYEI